MEPQSLSALPTCYRHPDRETRLGCSSCDRPICTDCVRVAAVGQKCPECAEQPAAVRAAERRVRRSGTPVTMSILVICVVLFLFGQVPALGERIYFFGVQLNQLVDAGQWYRLLTSAFLHAGITHLLFNMWALYVFGPQLEREVGSLPFLGLYLSSAVVGGLVFFVLGPNAPAVGASGAIFGLFGAWVAASWRNRHTLAGQAGLRQLLLLLAINLALPLIIPGIAWEAHVGGLVAGAVIATLWTVPHVAASLSRRAAVAAAVGLLGIAVAAFGG